ncbi:MAG: hypothetical protein HDR31_00370 [Mycoplasma sp.]|nr:hypothetical protein [Mycoplasma sp.]
MSDVKLSERKISRLEELENNKEFQKLPYEKKVILIAGEKILEMEERLKIQSNWLSAALREVQNKTSHSSDEIKELFAEYTKNSLNDKEKILEIVEKKCSEEFSNIEDRFELATNQSINLIDNSINDALNEALEKVKYLSDFEEKAKQEIKYSQDRISILENEIHEQKEENENIKLMIEQRFDEIIVQQQTQSSIDNYEFNGLKFNSLEELEEMIQKEAQKVAKDEIDRYIHDYSLFAEDRENETISKLESDTELNQQELLKVYKMQIENNSKLSDLEYLLEEQNRQIKMLSEERQDLVLKVDKLIKEGNLSTNDELVNLFNKVPDESNPIDSQVDSSQEGYPEFLTKEEIEILIKRKAIELVKEKLQAINKEHLYYELYSSDLEELDQKIEKIKEYSKEKEEKFSNFEEVNKRIKDLETQLKNQINENINLKNDLFDEISKNGNINQNNDNIKNGYNEQINNLDEERELMKHNYYNDNGPIPGTKITRINNYKINSDIDMVAFGDAQQVIKDEAERLSQSEIDRIMQESKLSQDNWQENNQKLLDLENIISKQEEEIERLKNETNDGLVSKDEIELLIKKEALKIVRDELGGLNKSESNVDDSDLVASLRSTIAQLQELTSAQEKTISDIEITNKKIEAIEAEIRKSSKDYDEEKAKRDFDELLKEQYKVSSAYQSNSYAEELKKIEEERKKIEETLELERFRLLSEIEDNKRRLAETPVQQPQVVPVVVNPIIQEAKPQEQPKVEENKQFVAKPKEEINVILETPKKKRKQQVFYEVKVHTTPKLTRADLEK